MPQVSVSEGQLRPAPLKVKLLIRLAVREDVDGIVNLLRVGHQESDRQLPEIEMPHTRNWALNIIGHNATFLALDGRFAVGIIMLAPVHLSWSTKPCQYESMHFYVLKHYRKSGAAAKLVDRTKVLSDTTNLPVYIGISYGGLPEYKDRFLRLEGFEYIGGNHLYTPRPQTERLAQLRAIALAD